MPTPTLPTDTPTRPPTPEEERNIQTINKWLPVWFANLRRTIPLITSIIEEYGDRNSAEAIPEWFKKSGNGCALIIGSGPSLELLDKKFLDNWNGLVIAGASNATIPAALGRPADIIMAVDASPETAMQLSWLGSSINNSSTRLITHPYIHPDVVKNFPKDRIYFFKSFIPYAAHPLNWYQSLLFNGIIQNFMLQAGCTANSQYSWTVLPVDDDQNQYIKKTFLLGVDYAYPPDPSGGYLGRVRSSKYNPLKGTWAKDAPAKARSRSQSLLHNGFFTDQAMMGYKQSFLTLWVISKMQAFNCSPYSLMEELPKADLEEVGRTQGESATPMDYKEILKIYRAYNNLPGVDDKLYGTQRKDRAENHNLKLPNAGGRGLVHEINAPRVFKAEGYPGQEDISKGTGDGLERQGGEIIPSHDASGALHVVGNQGTSTIEDSKRKKCLETEAVVPEAFDIKDGKIIPKGEG